MNLRGAQSVGLAVSYVLIALISYTHSSSLPDSHEKILIAFIHLGLLVLNGVLCVCIYALWVVKLFVSVIVTRPVCVPVD